ncbi:MAG: ABC transporter ATP-binding protein [Planctomyces sp.]|nr:ABC transporter ATP-binding protein [Planctomyces sp.]
MSHPAIQVEQLTKSYRTGAVTTPVLRDVSLTATPGECLFLAGPSGSGKTTLLSILGCVLSADSGRVRLLGEDVSRMRPRDLVRFRRERIGFVFQRFHLFEGLEAWENVRLPCDLLGIPRRDGREQAMQLLQLVGLADRAHHRISQLSMGQRQRVALARALAGGPELILADEPTASLDADSGAVAMHLLKELCSGLRKTVVVVTHDNRIFSFADRMLMLVDGRIAKETVHRRADEAQAETPAEYAGVGAA